MIAAPLPPVHASARPHVELHVRGQRVARRIEIRGRATGPSHGRFMLYAARRCSARRRAVAAHGRFRGGSFAAQLAVSVLPVRRGRVCFRLRRHGRTVLTVSRRYRAPVSHGR